MTVTEIIDSMVVTLSDDLGYPGLTDGNLIKISAELSDDEKKVVLLHELGHILLQHMPKAKVRGYEIMTANLAGDAEIAITMYGDEEEEVINRPRSPLNGGITRKWVNKNAPRCKTFDELYRHLKSKPPSSQPNFTPMAEGCPEASETDEKTGKDQTGISTKEAIGRKIAELEKSVKVKKSCCHPINDRRMRRGVSDYISDVAKEALARRKSFRRPPRRPSEPFLKKGVATERTRPKINVYVDRSGSFNAGKTAEAEREIRSLSSRYGYLVDFDLFYFGGYLSLTDNVTDKSTNYIAVADHIASTRPRLAIVITDDDPCGNLPSIQNGTTVLVKMIECQTSPFADAINAKIC